MADQAIKAAEGPSMGQIFARGFLTENPSLRQMLGLCPTLAVTTAVTNGLGMGMATTFVLVCSGIVVSLLRKLIPSSVRIPAFVTDRIVRGAVALSQGGWYTPDKDGVDVRGSINVLTYAYKPSPVAKGNPQHTNLVEVRKYEAAEG